MCIIPVKNGSYIYIYILLIYFDENFIKGEYINFILGFSLKLKKKKKKKKKKCPLSFRFFFQ